MHDILIVHKLNAGQYLVSDHQHGFQAELTSADVKIVLQRCSKEFRDEEIEVTVLAVPQQARDADAALDLFENASFIIHQVEFVRERFAFDSTVRVGLHISAGVNGGEVPFVELVLKFEPATYTDLQRRHVVIAYLNKANHSMALLYP